MKNAYVDALLEKLMAALPSNLSVLGDDVKRSFRPLLQTAFDDAGVVTREDFDAQVRVLHATRAQLTQLQRRIDAVSGSKHEAEAAEAEV